MKKQSRLTALLLALCMLMSTLPVSALADGILTLEDYLSAVQRVQQELSEPSIPVEEENAYTLTRTTATETIVRETVTGELSGEGESAFPLPLAGKLELSTAAAADAYQWQIDVGGVWANIVGDTAAAVTLTYAKVQNALSGGTARVRCAMTQDGQTVYSAVAAVTVDETVKTQTVEGTEEISAVSYTSEAPRSLARTLNAGVGTYNAVPLDDTPSTYNVVINYLFENNEIVSDPYTASLAAGSDFSATVTFPTVQGYLPFLGEEQKDSLELNYKAIDKGYTYNVVYKPTNVDYTVIHYQQNLNDDKYTEAEREPQQGLTNSTVPEVEKTYDGFYALLYEKPKIAANGSTVVEVYYDRYYYLMNFDLDGGYGVEPIYARYGAAIGNVGTPTKAGYTFQGWSLNGTDIVSLPTTMPVNGATYKAVWKANDTAKVTIVFWGENADDEGYSYIDSSVVTMKPEESFKYNPDNSLICVLEEHEHSEACGERTCGLEEHTHSIENGCYKLTCTIENHTHENCKLDCKHEHDLSCYYPVYGRLGQSNKPSEINTPEKNGVYTYDNYFGTHYYLYLNGVWYTTYGYTGFKLDNLEISESCSHTHNDSCYTCGKTANEHEHTLKDCYTLDCSKQEHTHTSECGYTCGKITHKHTDDCYMKGLDTDLWTFVRSDEVVIAADGSTVVNVYFDRVEKTLTFKYNYDSRKGYQRTKEIKAKWGQNIAAEYVAIANEAGSTFWSAKENASGPYTNYFGVMPKTSATYYNRGTTGNNGTMTYWGQDLNGQYTVKLFEVTGVGGYTVTKEDRYEFEGFTYDHGTNIGSSCGGAAFYYTRNSYKLTFNDGYKDVKSETVLYQAQLSTYSSYKPDAPSAYEKGSVTFGGWYLNPECTGAEYKLDEHTMPADNVLLYAKWVPVTHTVKFYLNKDAYDAGAELGTHPDITVPHGSKAAPTPAIPTNGNYTFVGWFYMDNDVEKAFDFANMPVNKDLKVYGKWSSNVLKEYTIYYKIKDTDTEIADPTTGSGLAGITKTFDAKGGTELYADYQEGYFPVTKSHSLTLDINATEENDTNVYTFWYVQKPAVPYTVKYLNKETGEPVATEKTVSNNRKAVVTETFVPVKGMMPDAYQKRLVVSVDKDGNPDTEHNVIIFYYTKDTTHAYYKITHYTENLAKDAQGKTTWTEYASSQAVGDIGTKYSADPMTIPGFTHDPTVQDTVASGELTANGLELKLYYKRNSYPYQVRYLEKDTGKQLADPKNGTGKYGQVISESAIEITNYDAVDPKSQTLNIRIETGNVAKLNVITFYYTEKEATINYKMVGPDGTVSEKTSETYGSITSATETLKVLSGNAQGSTATVTSDEYRFVGWYTDAACTAQNLVSTDAKYVPTQPSHTDNGETVKDPWVAATYYAKFEYNLTTLKVTKSGMQSIDAGQSFLFKVSGPNLPEDGLLIAIHGNDSETISGLVVGQKYTVTEVEDWSWRYSAEPQSITLQPTGNEVIISNTRDKTQWLDGDCYAENVFNKQGN